MMQAVIYARWSSLEQGKGSTLARQIANCERYAATHELPIIETITDAGLSAYTGANIEKGNLGKFAKSMIAGARPDTILLVEELDRLSRQPGDVMVAWMSPLIRAGLTIIVTQTGQRIDRNMLDNDLGGLMTILFNAFGSNKESRKKVERVGAAWAKKRSDAREGKAVQRNHRHPAWLSVEDGEWQIDPARKRTVERIFEMRVRDNLGKGMIAKRLNACGEPTWSRAALWTPTYVGRLLSNRALLGEWQPHTWPRGQARPAPVGEPIESYYPRIIDDATFAAANAKREANQRKHQGRGQSMQNLLGPLARCADCGGQMVALGSPTFKLRKRTGQMTRHYFLYCQRAKLAKSCGHARGWTYDRIEGPLLDRLLTLAMDDQSFAQADTLALERAVLTARGRVDEIEARLRRLLDMVEDGDDAAQERYRQRRVELGDAKTSLASAEDALAEARGVASPDAHIRRVAEVRELMASDDDRERFEARSKVKAALGALIDQMNFYPATGPFGARPQITVELIGGVGMLAMFPDDGEAVWMPAGHPERVSVDPDESATVQALIRRTSTPA